MSTDDRQTFQRHFQEEAGEHLQALAKTLAEIDKQRQGAAPPPPEAFDDVLRRLHSIKGAGKVIGATEAATLTHALEAVIAELRAQRLALDSGAIELAVDAVDVLKDCVDALGAPYSSPKPEQMISKLFALIAATRPASEGVDSSLPGFDPEVRGVLSESQLVDVGFALESGKRVWEVCLEAGLAEAPEKLEAARKALEGVGELLASTGVSASADDRRRFKFVVATRSTDDGFGELCSRSGLEAVDPGAAGAAAPVPDVSAPVALVPVEDLPPLPPPPPLEIGAPGPPLAEEPAPGAQPPAAEDEEFERKKRELVVQYLNQGAEEADKFSKDVLALEANPGDLGTVNGLFRLAHNLKGSAGMYGLPGLSKLAAHIERLLDGLRNKRLACTPSVVNVLLAASDALRELFAVALGGDHAAEAPGSLLETLQATLQGGGAPVAAAQAGPAERKPKPLTRGSIRVALEKLDRLVNLGGEMTLNQNSREAAVKAVDLLAERAKALLRRWQKLGEEIRAVRTAMDFESFARRFNEMGAELEALESGLENHWSTFSTTTLGAAAVADALQDEIMRVRMVPVATLFDNAPRLIRELTKDKVREVELTVSGEDTGMDKNVLELMSDPLMHLIRNAVDHGIEPAAEREKGAKPRKGRVRLAAEHQGSHIVITVSDDGKGMDPKVLKAKAVEKGLVSAAEAQTLTTEQAFAFIFHPGFSTKEQVTEISGRGVGMDVVRHNIENLKGRIDIESVVGKGTTFSLRLPLSLSVIQAVLLECGPQTFCLQASAVLRIVQVPAADVEREDGYACFELDGRTVPMVRLHDLFGLPREAENAKQLTTVVTQATQGTIGFVVDRALEEQTVVLKEMGSLLHNVPYVSGGTILPDGRISIVLDPAGLVAAASRGAGKWEIALVPVPRRKHVLVVDDSLTAREMLRVVLENAGYGVLLARNGREAARQLEAQPVDAVVSDVQMPEMDGYGLTGLIRSTPKWSRLPVVLVTALAKDEERLRGLQAGADAYIAKGAFDQTGLLARIEELLGRQP